MTRALLSAVVVILIAPAETSAHRLDEYLQAMRVSLERGRISIEIDLTPGAIIASGIITLLDRDRDGQISPLEAQAYGEDVLSDLIVEFDGVPVAVVLTRVELPPLDGMRHGLGAIRLQALSEVGPFSAGRHHVHLRNSHAPVPSVYLVNALVPDDRDIGVIAQTRDPQQQEVRIEYEVRSRWLVQLVSIMLAFAGCGVLVWFRGYATHGSDDCGGDATISSSGAAISATTESRAEFGMPDAGFAIRDGLAAGIVGREPDAT